MKKIFFYVIILIIFTAGVKSLVRCPNVTTVQKFSRFSPMQVICELIAKENFINTSVRFIKANFTTENCTYSPITKAYLSPKVIIKIESKTVYRRNPMSHTVRPSCVPDKAEYITDGIYFLTEYSQKLSDGLKLEDKYKDDVCKNFMDEASAFNSGNGSHEEVVKFIRRVTSHDGITGIIQDGRINYVHCDTIDLPVVSKSIIESECFYGTKIETNDGQSWYTINGLDIINKTEVNTCLQSDSYSILQSLTNSQNLDKKKNLQTFDYEYDFDDDKDDEPHVNSFEDKFNVFYKALLNFDGAELAIFLIGLSLLYAIFWFCICGCFTSYCTHPKGRRHNASFVSYV